MGIYRDDGLGLLKDAPGNNADAAIKHIICIFQWYVLTITIHTNFLDALFNLGTTRRRP